MTLSALSRALPPLLWAFLAGMAFGMLLTQVVERVAHAPWPVGLSGL